MIINPPKGETIWEQRIVEGKTKYIVTSKITRDIYFLYEVNGDKLTKLDKGDTPKKFEKRMSE